MAYFKSNDDFAARQLELRLCDYCLQSGYYSVLTAIPTASFKTCYLNFLSLSLVLSPVSCPPPLSLFFKFAFVVVVVVVFLLLLLIYPVIKIKIVN